MAKKFSEIALKSDLQKTLAELEFSEMTPIQEKTFTPISDFRDVLAQSKTGSGKTLAFSLPVLNKINLNDRSPQFVVICPTRELAQQVTKELRKFGRGMAGFAVLLASGGTTTREQVESLENGVHGVVATPGRLVELIEREAIDLEKVKTIIIDEADKVFEMGFQKEIKFIFKSTSQKRQTLLFSATFPEAIEKLSSSYQIKPMRIKLEGDGEVPQQIELIAYDITSTQKIDTLMRVLQQHEDENAIIFCNQKSTVDEIYEKIKSYGVKALALHGGFDQSQRDRVMTLFRNQSCRLLITTDIASRGLDIDHLELVINYDWPAQSETFIHRIGRTGRAEKSGRAVVFFNQSDYMKIVELESIVKSQFVKPKLGFQNQHGLGSTLFYPKMATLQIAAGRKDKLRPGDIVGSITSLGIKADKLGKIDLFDHQCFVAIDQSEAQNALKGLRLGKIKGKKYSVKLESI